MAKSSQFSSDRIYALDDFGPATQTSVDSGSGLLEHGVPRQTRGSNSLSKPLPHNPLGPVHYTQESPKTVLTPGVSCGAFAIHLVALIATGAVVCLSFANVYAFDEGPMALGTDTLVKNVLHLLQFAAKLHEIIIVGSLTTMVMYFLRRRLVDSHGIPLGLLTGAYQASTLSALFNKSIWAGGLRREGLFTLLLVLSIIYANVVGPSSAIAMIPNLDWWPVANPFSSQPLPAFSGVELTNFYSMGLRSPNQTDLYGCTTSNYSYMCPGGGFNELYMWSNAYSHAATSPNITMTEAISGTQRQVLSSSVEVNDSYVAITTTHHQSMLQLTGLFYDYVKRHERNFDYIHRPMIYASDDSQVGAAVVQVQCDVVHFEDARAGNVSVKYPTSALNNFSTQAYPMDGSDVRQSLYNYSHTLNTTNFTWVDLADSGTATNGAPSLGALVTLPLRVEDSNNVTVAQHGLVVPCTIDARWASTQLLYDPTNDNAVFTNLSDPTIFARQYTPSEQRGQMAITRHPIYINPTWAAMLNVPGILANDFNKQALNTTMIQALLESFVGDKSEKGTPYRSFGPPKFTGDTFDQSVMRTVSTVLSVAVADGLSRSVYGRTAPIVVLDADPANVTFVGLGAQSGGYNNIVVQDNNFTLNEMKATLPYVTYGIKRYGYGYGWSHSSRTVRFGIAILLLHAVAAAAFMLYRACGGRSQGRRRWSSKAWENVGELVALALVSSDRGPREVMDGVAGGVEKSGTWEQYVRIRERGASGLEMVVDGRRPLSAKGDESWDDEVKIGKKYR